MMLPSAGQLQGLYCLAYFMAHGGGIITVSEAATNHVVPILSISQSFFLAI
jgi:hypothetical protein